MKVTDRAIQNPYFIFLIDGMGACITALSLIFILPNLPAVFNMPTNILYLLGTIALVFSAYSLGNFIAKRNKINLRIRIIAIANLTYCLFSVVIVIQLFSRLTSLDIVYFVSEILIVITLAIFELRVANNIE